MIKDSVTESMANVVTPELFDKILQQNPNLRIKTRDELVATMEGLEASFTSLQAARLGSIFQVLLSLRNIA